MKLLITLSFLLLLGACQGVEMPQDPNGTDEMRISPCACAEIEYDPAGFIWENA